MTTRTAEQIEKELKELTASKKELESKITSLNHELYQIRSNQIKKLLVKTMRIDGMKILIN